MGASTSMDQVYEVQCRRIEEQAAEIGALRERIRQAHDLIFLYACDEIVAEWEATPEVQRALGQEPKP